MNSVYGIEFLLNMMMMMMMRMRRMRRKRMRRKRMRRRMMRRKRMRRRMRRRMKAAVSVISCRPLVTFDLLLIVSLIMTLW